MRLEDAHDPGGKVRLKLADGTVGSAVFSDCGQYRTLLERSWEGAVLPGYVLWVGMNPSTAAADVDDPTVAKECKYTRRWGYGRYIKTNVMDYRATKPKMLLAEGVVACSERNLPAIVGAAKEAAVVVLGFGALHRRLATHGIAVVKALEEAGVKPLCLDVTKAGFPKHPLYILDAAEPFEYPGLAA